jgi:predicted ATP-grasp superfamily ATP-dependent carboligase
MPTVLLTGGRAPVTLDLARKFSAKAWRVIVAESIPTHLCKRSSAVAQSYLVPSPRFEPDAFVTALQKIIEIEQVTLLVPTCEEVFTIGQGHEVLSSACTVLTEPLERLLPLHSKFHFIEIARSFGLNVPQTSLVQNTHAAQGWLGQAVVFKPEYSRFATEILINPTRRIDLQLLDISPDRSWVAQEFIAGRQICTYSVAHQGHLSAHCAYATEFKVGRGSTIAFQAIDHPQAEAWVKTFVEKYDFTGQIAFDFIETSEGKLYAIECNPRAISGVHLFDDGLVDALRDQAAQTVRPPQQKSVAVWLALLLYGWQSAPSLEKWFKRLTSSRDVIFDRADWQPFFAQFSMFVYMLRLSRCQHINLIEATTFDIEWNEPLTLPEMIDL